MSLHGHICGCYFSTTPVNQWSYPVRRYLPQVDVKVHSTILSTTSRTSLTQKFVNPSSASGIKELRYTFPLYDGVSVVGFTCRVGDRVIIGEVKEKEKARAIFQEAVERGEVAGLLEQLPEAADVFTTTIGNVPPKATITVEITYLGELKHDAEVDGVRLTLPTVISPRYGSYPGEIYSADSLTPTGGNFSVTIDANLAEGFHIREMRSPTHPIAVTIGSTSTAPEASPALHKASATLSLNTVELEKDFVLQVVSKEFANPSAVIESHPTIPGHRAIMATLVPRFQLTPQRPEIVFICDRSGSMMGPKIPALVNALNVFLKSLPQGVMFNICSFGSHYEFLWDKSKSYSQSNLEKAIKYVKNFDANFGGTEMLNPVKETFKRRYSDRALEIFLVTDGEIWNQDEMFSYLNSQISEKKAPVRVFTLGVGDSVSHSLIEGVARAGNGFCQSVGEQEKMDGKVVRMLKAALTPHINDYEIDIKYGAEDFEMIEKVSEGLNVNVDVEPEKSQNATKKVISLFDTKANPDEEKNPQESTASIPEPKILQAPNTIPPLFPFSRTNIYLLLPATGCQDQVSSVILRGTSPDGPLELEIPVKTLDQPGETIHQLAAKKAVQELEEGRGWLNDAKDKHGKLLKKQYPSRFDDMVHTEAVRLGVRFQVGGKWCSFVAVETKNSKGKAPVPEEMEFELLDADMDGATLSEGSDSNVPAGGGGYGGLRHSSIPAAMSYAMPSSVSRSGPPGAMDLGFSGAAPASKMKKMAVGGSGTFASIATKARGVFGSSVGTPASQPAPQQQQSHFLHATPAASFRGASPQISYAAAPPPPPAPAPVNLSRRMESPGLPKPSSVRSRSYLAHSSKPQTATSYSSLEKSKETMSGHIEELERDDEDGKGGEDEEFCERSSTSSLQDLIALQRFEGSWNWAPELFKIIGIDSKAFEKEAPTMEKSALATALAIWYLENRLANEKDSWELLVDKARDWLKDTIGTKGMDEALKAAQKVFA